VFRSVLENYHNFITDPVPWHTVESRTIRQVYLIARVGADFLRDVVKFSPRS
jgi:hypothetical protein